MKNLVFAFALLCSSSLVAQFSFNENGTGIQSPNSIASGIVSTAMGYNTQASGDYSTAMGSDTTASDYYSVAMGSDTTASGIVSTAMGTYSTASGDASTAMGAGTVAQDYASTSIGNYNKIDETPNPSVFDSQNTVFVIGNGSGNNNRSNALEILFDGTTTITGNVTAPAFIGDGSQLTNLPTPTVNYGEITNVPLSYNENGTGIQSAYATASGSNSTAMGYFTTASGFASTAMGELTLASGTDSTAMGANTTASGNGSTARGNRTKASGFISTTLGFNTTASGTVSTAMGDNTQASGSFSTAMGQGTSAQDYGTIAIGIFNKTKETSNPNQYSLQNTAFVIGNGLSDNRSNALEVLFDGTTTIAGDLNINSDARLKANIISLGATLSKLLQIDGKTYTMKKDANHKKKIGLLAQDIEKVFPELVTETNDIKSVNYQGLVPVLINAMKEQQDEIERLKKQEAKLNKQQQEIDELKAMVKALVKG